MTYNISECAVLYFKYMQFIIMESKTI